MKAIPLMLLFLAAGCASTPAPVEPGPDPVPTGPPRQAVETVVVRGVWVRAGDSVDGASWSVTDGVRTWYAEQKELELRHSVNADGSTDCRCKGPLLAVPTRTWTLTPESARARIAGGELVMHGTVPAEATSPEGAVLVVEVTCTLGGKCPATAAR